MVKSSSQCDVTLSISSKELPPYEATQGSVTPSKIIYLPLLLYDTYPDRVQDLEDPIKTKVYIRSNMFIPVLTISPTERRLKLYTSHSCNCSRTFVLLLPVRCLVRLVTHTRKRVGGQRAVGRDNITGKKVIIWLHCRRTGSPSL